MEYSLLFMLKSHHFIFLLHPQVFELRKLLPTSLHYDFNIHVSFNLIPVMNEYHHPDGPI